MTWVIALLQRVLMGEPWGEGWNGWWSLVEFGGFVVVVFGVMVYYNYVNCKKKEVV